MGVLGSGQSSLPFLGLQFGQGFRVVGALLGLWAQWFKV